MFIHPGVKKTADEQYSISISLFNPKSLCESCDSKRERFSQLKRASHGIWNRTSRRKCGRHSGRHRKQEKKATNETKFLTR